MNRESSCTLSIADDDICNSVLWEVLAANNASRVFSRKAVLGTSMLHSGDVIVIKTTRLG